MEFLENKLIEFESELGIRMSRDVYNMNIGEFTENEARIEELEIIIKFIKGTLDEIQNI